MKRAASLYSKSRRQAKLAGAWKGAKEQGGI